MGAALVLLLVGLGALAAGVLIGRYYVPDDRQLRRTARHSRAYMRALSHLIARDFDTVVHELRAVVEENVDDTEPYFALGAMFRSRGEHERAIRVHQALAMRERDKRKLRQRAMYELGLDFRAAGMPRRATRAMEEVLIDDTSHDGALRVLASLYEEQARFNEAAGLWQRIGKRRGEDTAEREHHLLVAAAQAALARADLESARELLKAAQKHDTSAHFFAAAAELAAARGNFRGARERIKQALAAEAGLAPHLLPALIAAEQGLAAGEPAGAGGRHDDLDEDAAAPLAPAPGGATTLAEAPVGTRAAAPAVASLPAAPAAETALVPAVPIAPAVVEPSPSVITSAADRRITLIALPTDAHAASASITDRVLAVLAEVEAQTGPRLELALLRAQLVPPSDAAAQAALAAELTARFPDAIAARVAAARLASASDDPVAIRAALDGLVGEHGALAWALRGRWQCAHCGQRPAAFSWRCGQCRRWGTMRMETGIEPPPVAPRERRAAARTRLESLLGASPDLPAAVLDPGLTAGELATAGARRSLLGRVGGWVSGAWRRDAP
jgi:lipopolysaccharide biosynthesis regulator YciM